ncbi:hypothetical protein FNJ88_06310 [Chryseobacterium sp. SNU WT5]|uniref:hypothetical protein n=1 Tax=Chryseobacterium sp. SNU WT5 TaxID=2594269 RepID=UPI00117E04F2|nr:hypothetical protein [Chryseobacterium sp. SNU WT5]QDP85195.1 hypothetical protein FNJ88_06310 [Chryseobacterium sp. SNU WT5]
MSKEITQKQIDAWKVEHGEIFALKIGDKICYLKTPNRKTLSYAAMAGQKDNMAFNEIILKQCWLGGDEEIQTNDGLFLSASSKLPELIQIKEAELVKL